jgi:pseudaminic acid biosynthesis-associated methylase
LGTFPAEGPVVSRQLAAWEGDFGTQYTDRNVADWRARLSAFRQMLEGLALDRILEVGCNRGHNLVTVAECLPGDVDVVGVEPNRHALELARAASPRVAAVRGHARDLPFKDGYFDLVFTAGVLIHVALGELPAVLHEITRVSRRYVLAIEYFAEVETPIVYRGHEALLWKRDFLAHYRGAVPTLQLRRQGYWGPEQGFDRTHWWLLEKPSERGAA